MTSLHCTRKGTTTLYKCQPETPKTEPKTTAQNTQTKTGNRNVAEYCWIVLLPILSSDKARAKLDVRAEPYSKLHVQPYSAKSLFPRERAEPYSAMDDSNVKSGARHRMTLEKGTVLPNRTRRHPDFISGSDIRGKAVPRYHRQFRGKAGTPL